MAKAGKKAKKNAEQVIDNDGVPATQTKTRLPEGETIPTGWVRSFWNALSGWVPSYQSLQDPEIFSEEELPEEPPAVLPVVPPEEPPAVLPVVPPAMPPTTEVLSPFYYALREMYLHLKEPEGYKHISIPRLQQYLQKLTEIKNNTQLKIGDKNLWETLNPPPPSDFRANQLLEKPVNGKNILEEAIEKHEQQYLSEFKDKLSVVANKYEPVGKCYYFEKSADDIIYLMLRDGAKPSREELQEAFREYEVICQDMSGSIDAKIYICDAAFTRNLENQKEIAAIVTHLDLTLASDTAVQGGNQAVHKTVQKFAKDMRDPEPATASKTKSEKDLSSEVLLNYRVMTSKGRLLPKAKASDNPERVRYLDAAYELEPKQEKPYLNATITLNRLLPEVKIDSYRNERTLVYLSPLETKEKEGMLLEEMQRRVAERKIRCEGERRIQTIKNFSQTAEAANDTTWLEKDSEAAQKEALSILQNIAQDDKGSEAVAAEGSVQDSDTDLDRALQNSLVTYKAEQRRRELDQCQYLNRRYNFTIQDVLGDGNCFYRAVAEQMTKQGVSTFTQPGVELHVSLRHLVQGRNFKNGEWAGVRQLFTLAEKAKVIIAVVDTRYPELGFRCYFRDTRGRIAETSYPSELGQEADKTVIRLAYTGCHYMSVEKHSALREGALRKEFDITQPRPSAVLRQPSGPGCGFFSNSPERQQPLLSSPAVTLNC